ncbi:MAG: hypothetical protein J0H46_02315 [Bacteroidetes bacterium]|nr:hypothetical protein [Bacteroidota bacterium]
MKTQRKRVAAKGDRLNWTPLKDVKPVKLSGLNVKGRVVVITKDSKAKSAKILVP